MEFNFGAVIGVTTEGLYVLKLSNANGYFAMSSVVCNAFSTGIDKKYLYDYIKEYYTAEYVPSPYKAKFNTRKGKIKYIQSLTKEEKLNILHSDILYGSEFVYDDVEYMLECCSAGQTYLRYYSFLYSYYPEETRNRLQKLWDTKHLKDAQELTEADEQLIAELYNTRRDVFDVIEKDTYVQGLLTAHNFYF